MANPDGAAVVVDAGSDVTKVGFASEDVPRGVFPTVLGRLRDASKPSVGRFGWKPYYVGDEALAKRGILGPLQRMIRHGLVQDWEAMEQVLMHAFENEMRCLPGEEDRAVLLGEKPWQPPRDRQKTAELMFEKVSVPALWMGSDTCLALFASGITTGMVVDIGSNNLGVAAAYEGHALRHSACHYDLGGNTVFDLLLAQMTERGYTFTSSGDRMILTDLKEKLTYVSLQFDQDMIIANSQNYFEIEKHYELPSGQVITVGNERFRCTEWLFNPRPTLLPAERGDFAGIVHAVKRCITKGHGVEQQQAIPTSEGLLFSRLPGELHEKISKSLPPPLNLPQFFAENVILAGGCTLIPGLCDRLERDMANTLPRFKPKVRAPPERKYSVWIGGSILGSLSSCQKALIPKDVYKEVGSAVVNSYCFM